MSLPTLYAPTMQAPTPGRIVRLDRDEARHLRALRLRPGARVRVTDGRGGAAVAEVRSIDRSDASCVVLDPLSGSPTLPVELAFGVANKDRTLWLVEKAVELGASALRPLECARSRSVADGARSPRFWERAERRSVAALKQCGGIRLPRIEPVVELDEWLEAWSSDGSEASAASPLGFIACQEAERSLSDGLSEWSEGRVSLLIGPEGGFEAEERSACERAGLRPAHLGTRTLRFETAAVAGLAVIAQRAGSPAGRARRPAGADAGNGTCPRSGTDPPPGPGTASQRDSSQGASEGRSG